MNDWCPENDGAWRAEQAVLHEQNRTEILQKEKNSIIENEKVLREQVNDELHKVFLIEKNGQYYRPNAQGYTGLKAEAGRYSFDEATARSTPNGLHDGMSIWNENDAPEFSSGCAWDLKLKHQRDIAIVRAEDAERASRYETDLAQQALEDMELWKARAERAETELAGLEVNNVILEKLPPDCAPKGCPVLVEGGIAMKKVDEVWYTGMEEPAFERPIQWEVKWWSPIPQ